jgi:hypothetical protein
LITRTAAGYSYSGNWASSTGGIYHPLEHQLASLQPQPERPAPPSNAEEDFG